MTAPDGFFLGLDYDENSNQPINFIETRFHDLSPFSAHEVEIAGVIYKTAEHAYQALRVVPNVREEIQTVSSPLNAWRIAQECKKKGLTLEGFDKDAIMEQVFRAKLQQHADIERILKATKERELRKVFDTDYYWGTGADGTGENKMGKLWMKLRAELLSI